MRRSLLALLLAGCAWTPGHQAERFRESLIDLPERALARCLGAPGALVVEDEAGPRYWVYAIPLPAQRGQDVVIEADIEGTPSPSARRGPRVVQGELSTEMLSSEFRRDPEGVGLPPGWCRLTFELASGRVRALTAVGRGRDDLNADARCLRAVSHCARE